MAHTFSCSSDAPLVRTTGGSVRGYRFDGLDIFKGIPYAKARRFHAPKPAVWDGVLDSTSYGYVCPLLEMPKPNGEMLVPHRYWLMDEACQNLNIWTPALDDAHRPVLVWLHGGGYFAGSSIEQIAYEGENMARLGDCVVVSINHRLNILGYLDLSDFGAEYANSGNAGGDDIIAALRWVRDNIAAFGGDPGNVTMFGQSGGGAKVTTLLQTPAADGLFHKGIVMSGVLGRLADCTGSGRDCAEALMAELGAADIAALETVPYAALAAAYNKVAPALKAAGKNTGCAPHPNAFYLGNPLENAFRPETARIPLLVGTVFGEFAAFNGFGLNKAQMSTAEAEGFAEKMLGKQTADALLPLFHAAYPERSAADLPFLDVLFREPTMRYIRRRAETGPVWSYFFNQDFTIEGGRAPWHCSDIPFVFHNTELVPSANISGVTPQLEQQIFDAVLAFARTGNPQHSGIPTWPASTPQQENTMLFDSATRLAPNHDKALIAAALPAISALMARNFDPDSIQH